MHHAPGAIFSSRQTPTFSFFWSSRGRLWRFCARAPDYFRALTQYIIQLLIADNRTNSAQFAKLQPNMDLIRHILIVMHTTHLSQVLSVSGESSKVEAVWDLRSTLRAIGLAMGFF